MFGKTVDPTDYSKPFTVKAVTHKITYTGKLKYIPVYVEQFKYPEPMLARASQLRNMGYTVWTFEPEPGLWHDDRAPYVDQSFELEDVYEDNYDYEGKVIPF